MRRAPKLAAVMTPFPHSVDVDDQLGRAKALMKQHGIRHLPVTHDGELRGVLSERDVERTQLLGMGLGSRELTVRDATALDAYVVPLDTPLTLVLEEMAARGIGSAIVTREGKLAGIFTTVDACRSFAEWLHLSDEPDDGVA